MNAQAQLRDFLQSIHLVEKSILEAYISEWQDYSLPRKTIMTAPGETERFMYFVVKGVQKSYYLQEAKMHVMAFTYPPSFSGIPESFLPQQPAQYFLETITDSTFLRISYEKHQQLMQEYRPIETLFRKATEAFLIGLAQRHYELMGHDIETRFRLFVKRSPHLLQLVTQKDMASYLGIDASNFSKLMGRIKI